MTRLVVLTLACVMLALVVAATPSTAVAQAATHRFATGDVFVASRALDFCQTAPQLNWYSGNPLTLVTSLSDSLGGGWDEGMAVDPDQYLYVARTVIDCNSGQGYGVILKYGPDPHGPGVVLRDSFGADVLRCPHDIIVGRQGHLYISDGCGTNGLVELDTDGTYVSTITSLSPGCPGCFTPIGLDLGPDGCTLYSTDIFRYRIYRFNLCTSTALAPLELDPSQSGDTAYLRVLQNGDFLVVVNNTGPNNSGVVRQLDASGNFVRDYVLMAADDADCLVGISLDTTGNSFFAVSWVPAGSCAAQLTQVQSPLGQVAGVANPPNAYTVQVLGDLSQGHSPARYMVQLQTSIVNGQAVINELAQQYSFTPTLVLPTSQGFAAILPPTTVANILSDARVFDIGLDGPLDFDEEELVAPSSLAESQLFIADAVVASPRLATDPPPPCPNPDQPANAHQEADHGLCRIGASSDGVHNTLVHKGVGVGVAVLDTGIIEHPDLPVPVASRYCLNGPVGPITDEQGHGTHVTGIIAGRDNQIGYVGVAPGVSLYVARIANALGNETPGPNGTFSSLWCGVDFAIQQKQAGQPVQVINASFGGATNLRFGDHATSLLGNNCTSQRIRDDRSGQMIGDVMHEKFCQALQNRIVSVVAAGNESENVQFHTPATFPEVLNVAAMVDWDGRPGGLTQGAFDVCLKVQDHGFLGSDDTFGSFSNYGTRVTIAAPGACIQSTTIPALYAPVGGTSHATPFVAGAVALYLETHSTQEANRVPQSLLDDVRGAMLRFQEPGPIQGDPTAPPKGTPAIGILHLASPLVYVTNPEAATLTVIAPATDLTTPIRSPAGPSHTIVSTGRPVAVAVSKEGDHIYVANQRANTVSIIDTLTAGMQEQTTAVLPVGRTPMALALSPDETRLYVLGWGSDDVTVIDVVNRKVVATFDKGIKHPEGIAVSPDGQHIYVSLLRGFLAVLDAANGTVVRTVDLISAGGGAVAVTPDGSQIYVTKRTRHGQHSGTVHLIDTRTWGLQPVTSVGGDPIAVAAAPDGRHVYVANHDSNSISVINTADPAQRADTIEVGQGPSGVAVSPDSTKLYVSLREANAVAAIDLTSTPAPLVQIVSDVPMPEGIAITTGWPCSPQPPPTGDGCADPLGH